MKKNLPQANDLNKVIDVMTYIYYHPKSDYDEIANYVGFTRRQAQYYVDACIYLNLVDEARNPTSICVNIFKNTPANITESVYERIILDDLIGQIFARMFTFPESDLDSFAQELVTMYYPEILSTATIERRAHNMVLWCRRIIKSLSLK